MSTASRLLLIHAFPLDSSMWSAQLAAFPDALCPDLPGFGASEPVGPVTTMDAAADRCVRAMDLAGVERAVVCGLSMGGYVAFSMWRRHRARVAGLVFANTKAEADDEGGSLRRVALAERLRAEGSGFLIAEPPPLLSDGADPRLRGEVLDIIGRQSAEAIAAASLGMGQREDSTATCREIDVPTLVIASSEDNLIPASVTMTIADLVPNAGRLLIDGVGHLSNMEAPDAFNEALEEHLERCRP
jgi:3-oxoadipate enol-lactonase